MELSLTLCGPVYCCSAAVASYLVFNEHYSAFYRSLIYKYALKQDLFFSL